MEVKATEKYIRISAKKARPVADIIRGKNAKQALVTLKFTQKKGAIIIAKALKSAIANAEHNYNLESDNLFVKAISIDNGPSLKRFRPRSRGMVSHILKRTSHITVVVSDDKLFDKKAKSEKSVKKGTKKIEKKSVKEEKPSKTEEKK